MHTDAGKKESQAYDDNIKCAPATLQGWVAHVCEVLCSVELPAPKLQPLHVACADA